MSNSRSLFSSAYSWVSWGTSKFTDALSYTYNTIKSTLTPRPGELLLAAIPIATSLTAATVFSVPSVVETLYYDTVLPTYLWRGIIVGGIGGFCTLTAKRLFGKKAPEVKHDKKADKTYAHLIKLKGTISANESFRYDYVAPLLKEAFSDEKSKGVVLQINSGGGSPTQSALIHNDILYLKEKHGKTVIVVTQDFLASGAYYIAVAADKIYVNESSCVGSIGVVSEDYSFHLLANTVGIERRTYTAGKYKRRNNKYTEEKKEDVEKIHNDLAKIHNAFINAIITNRGKQLGCDLLFFDKPVDKSDYNKYRGKYIVQDEEKTQTLNYINLNNEIENITIINQDKFNEELGKIKNQLAESKETQIRLTYDQAHQLITSNTKHSYHRIRSIKEIDHKYCDDKEEIVEIFSGDDWHGKDSIQLGLADKLGYLREALEDLNADEYIELEPTSVKHKKGLFDGLLNLFSSVSEPEIKLDISLNPDPQMKFRL